MADVRVLIVDDSPLVRDMLADILMSDSGISVVGMAKNGLEAISLTQSLKPDVVAMDITMPVMDGLEAIEKIMSTTPVPILVISDLDHSKIAFSALSKGALEVYQKASASEAMAKELIAKVKLLAKVKVIRHISPNNGRGSGRSVKLPEPPKASSQSFQVVAIASSTGGPRALAQIFSSLNEAFPVPIVVAQHMNDGFVQGLVDWLNGVSPIKVKFAADGELLRAGCAYFAPAGTHITVNAKGRVILQARAADDLFHPSCNQLLVSVGKAFGAYGVGIILTGMGDDGVEGIRCIREQGGYTIAQDEASSVVYGMPRVAIEQGVVDWVSPIGEIAGLLKQRIRPKPI
ncbi:MAG: chemotaxis-specific protein-glutamate methyltransferase CheB [Methylococcaceae bacterium]|nr:MAG: chemotaxis-specific protein-glutamate methyltransferase CheB [Methylococcaceae bacterium]